MKFSANWLNEYLKKKLSPEIMAELLTMHAFEVESCEKNGEDFVLDIKVLPDRAHDCMSHIGIAKELAAISGIVFVPPKMKFEEDRKLKAKNFISVEVPAKDLCPRYSMRVACGIKIGQSPKWMQERLSACGLRPISNIVDITNYVMLETGQPLHAFDVDKVGGKKMIVRRASEGEKITTLEGKTYNLSSQNLVIADAKVAIGIAGIKGGEGPEIDENTKIVAIESANFEPTNIRRTSKTFNLRTDASMRFENGLDPGLTEIALDRSISLIAEIAGGKVAQGLVDAYPVKTKPRKIFMDVAWAQGLIGLAVKPQEIVEILARLDIRSKIVKRDTKRSVLARETKPSTEDRRSSGTWVEATAPTSRLDLQAQEDLAEEIVRILGYEKVPVQIPSGLMIPAVKEESLIYEDKIKDILAGAGWSEAQNYSFISDADKKAFKLSNAVEIKNPFSQDQKHLRPTLVVNLLKNVKENLKYFESARLFELGRVFLKEKGNFNEQNKIAAVVSGKNNKKPTEILFELKGLIHLLFEKLGIDDIWFDDAVSKNDDWTLFAHPSRRAEIKSGDKIIGWAAEISQEALGVYEIKEKVAVFELDFDKLAKLASEERMYVSPSKYPAIMRDLAVVVSATTKVEEILNVIEIAGGELLADTDLFDMYEGLIGGKKSMAFRLTFQSDERNLTDEEVNKIMAKIIGEVEKKGWEIRK